MATGDGDEDGGSPNFVDMEGVRQYQLADMVSDMVVEKLAATAPFTAEDIERIKDHVHPQGVAFWNGYKHAMDHVERMERLGYVSFEVMPKLREMMELGKSTKP